MHVGELVEITGSAAIVLGALTGAGTGMAVIVWSAGWVMGPGGAGQRDRAKDKGNNRSVT